MMTTGTNQAGQTTVPEPVHPVIEAWRRLCSDPSPEALMFPTFGRGKRVGQALPRHAKNFLRWRIKPIADRLEIPARLITFQVMRRSLGTHLSGHGTLKDTQGALRHASITTTGNVYVQVVEDSVMRAINSHASTVLRGGGQQWKAWAVGPEREAAFIAVFRVLKVIW